MGRPKGSINEAMTFEAIGKRLGMSDSRVRQLARSAMEKLRAAFEREAADRGVCIRSVLFGDE